MTTDKVIQDEPSHTNCSDYAVMSPFYLLQGFREVLVICPEFFRPVTPVVDGSIVTALGSSFRTLLSFALLRILAWPYTGVSCWIAEELARSCLFGGP